MQWLAGLSLVGLAVAIVASMLIASLTSWPKAEFNRFRSGAMQ